MFIIFVNFKGAHASCGDFRLQGTFYLKDPMKNSYYLLNEGSNSEETFTFDSVLDITKLSSYKEIPSIIEVEIKKRMDGTRGRIFKVRKMGPGISHPLKTDPSKNRKLLKENNCVK